MLQLLLKQLKEQQNNYSLYINLVYPQSMEEPLVKNKKINQMKVQKNLK